jgi:apolipoprotein N-acyltransferase
MQGATPYVAAGNWPILLISWVVLGVFWIRSRAAL